MKISIVTISFNQAKFLKECIHSVISQRRELETRGVQLEYIVVDPGSTDGSREIIESYGDEIIKIYENDRGPSDGLNKGFNKASGEIFGYINADDYLLPSTLSQVLEIFKNNSCDLIYGHGWVVDDNGKKLHRCLSHKFNLKQFALGNVQVMQQSTFFKRTAFEKTNKFNENNSVSWDSELLVDIVLSGAKHMRVNKFFSAFRVYDASISGSGKYLDACKVEHHRVACKISKQTNIDLDSDRRYEKLLTRIRDPYYLILRLIDEFQFGKRAIPS